MINSSKMMDVKNGEVVFMKLWKKAAAVALAAVMSLTLLTGCSGGGGGSVSIGLTTQMVLLWELRTPMCLSSGHRSVQRNKA